jgi:hypothetical protein
MQSLIICDICDAAMLPADLCILHVPGIEEALNCHGDCITLFLKCKGDLTLLPAGRLKRSVIHTLEYNGTVTIKATGITVHAKQGRWIISGLKISKEEGFRRIQNLATEFYGLQKCAINEFYTLDFNKQLVLCKK